MRPPPKSSPPRSMSSSIAVRPIGPAIFFFGIAGSAATRSISAFIAIGAAWATPAIGATASSISPAACRRLAALPGAGIAPPAAAIRGAAATMPSPAPGLAASAFGAAFVTLAATVAGLASAFSVLASTSFCSSLALSAGGTMGSVRLPLRRSPKLATAWAFPSVALTLFCANSPPSTGRHSKRR